MRLRTIVDGIAFNNLHPGDLVTHVCSKNSNGIWPKMKITKKSFCHFFGPFFLVDGVSGKFTPLELVKVS